MCVFLGGRDAHQNRLGQLHVFVAIDVGTAQLHDTYENNAGCLCLLMTREVTANTDEIRCR